MNATTAWTSERRFLAACRRQPVDATPVWYMRQAGAVLPGYRALRERYSVREIATTPELAAQVSVMAAETLDTDAAVMFADILLPLGAMGVTFELTTDGPVVANPIRTAADVDRLRPLVAEEGAAFVLDAVRLVRHALAGRRAVVGIAGGPFTLAAYLVEGGAARDYVRTRAFMYAEPAAFGRLLALLADATIAYLAAQVRAGAQALQLFDTHAGQLDPATYVEAVAPHMRRIFASLPPEAPTIHFAIHTGALLAELAGTGGDVIGVDHRQGLDAAWATIGAGRGMQGNLDGARLLAGWSAAQSGADAVLAAAGGRPGHIFNLGHGIAPGTDPGLLAELAPYVRERSRTA